MSGAPTYRALILDLDGTLVDSHAYTFAAFRHACAPFRSVLEDTEIYAAFGPDEAVILEQLVGSQNAAAAGARLQRYYAEHVHEVHAHAALLEVMRACRAASLPSALFTGRGRAATHLVLNALGLTDCFVAVFAGDDGEPKPAPDGVHQLAAAMQVPVRETLLVGDSALDMRAAAAAGAGARLATWYARGVTHSDDPAQRLTHPDELRPLLGLTPATP